MNKQEILNALKEGHTVKHVSFSDNETMKLHEGGIEGYFKFEDGYICTPYIFWQYRQGKEWDEGWDIVTDENDITCPFCGSEEKIELNTYCKWLCSNCDNAYGEN